MRRLRGWLLRAWTAVAGERADVDRDFNAELESHLAHHIDDQIRSGLSPTEARRRALAVLGGLDQTRERHRDQRGVRLVAEVRQDVRYACRMLARQPGFTAAAVLTLGLGLGANAALFGLIDGLMRRPLAVRAPEQLVQVTRSDSDTFGFARFDRMRQGATRLSSFVGVSSNRSAIAIEVDGAYDEAFMRTVTPNYFDALGVSAQLGRAFGVADTSYGDVPVAVVSDAWWRRRFGGAPDVLGRQIGFAARTFTIVGVAPAGFRGVRLEYPADVWVPATQREAPDSQMWTRGSWLLTVARLEPGATAEQAAAEASALAGIDVAVAPASAGLSDLRPDFARPLFALQLMVGLVLLVACANLASMLMARSAARGRELAVRRAVGASRGRVVRQLVTESLVLALAGGALALLVGAWLNGALLTFLPPEQRGATAALSFRLDAPALAFGFGAACLTALLFGLAPALQATRGVGRDALATRQPAAGRHTRGVGRALVAGEVALGLVLLVAAGLFVSTFRNLWRVDTGFVADDVVVADLGPLREVQDRTARLALYDEMRARALALPGVVAAGYTRIGQMTGGGIEYRLQAVGRPRPAEDPALAMEQRVSPGFLETMGTRLRGGRLIDARDGPAAPAVAVINEAFARLVFPDEPPVGRSFELTGVGADGPVEVVGLVEDSKWIDLREAPRPMFYRPAAQKDPPSATLVMRVDGATGAVMAAIPGLAASVDRRIRLGDVATLTEVVNRTIATERLLAWVSAGFGVLAALIAALGVYGTLAYGVALRTREIGVRMALGATRGRLRWLVVRESLLLFAAGGAAGALAAAFLSRFAASMLYGVTPGDPVTYAAAAGLLALVLLAAAWLPARRATAIDPMAVLRGE